MPRAAVTFDAAGTLFAPAEPVGATYARAAARHGIVAAPGDVERAFAAALAAAPPLAFPGVAADRLAAHERAWWASIVRASLGDRAPAAALDACVDELFAYYAGPGAWRVFPDVGPALTGLRVRGCRLAVVSNFDGRLDGLLHALGLAPLFDAVVHSTGAGAAKPAAAIFHAALGALGTTAAATLHVGDSVDADVEGARAAGLRAVLLDRRRRRPSLPPDVAIIDDLAGLGAAHP